MNPVGSADLHRKLALKYGEIDPDFIERRKKISPCAFPAFGEHSVQLLRTLPMHGEKSIKECYANLTRQMNHYIFIQNQYIQYEPWAEHLKECIQRLRSAGYKKEIYVFIVTSTPEKDGMDLPTYDVLRKIGKSEMMVQEHAAALEQARQGKKPKPITPEEMAKRGINVVMGSMWTCADKPGEKLRADDYDPPPICDTWKKHMPASRDEATYRRYIEARKVWRSKIESQLTREEAIRILTDVRRASAQGDWGARALLAYFHLHGLGPLDSNNVLDPDPAKAVEIARMAAAALLPWGLYDLGVAYEHGYGGAVYDVELAWAYYLKAAQLGSPEAQMALASAYNQAARFDDEETMEQCAHRQGHGPAAFALGVDRRAGKKNFKEPPLSSTTGAQRCH